MSHQVAYYLISLSNKKIALVSGWEKSTNNVEDFGLIVLQIGQSLYLPANIEKKNYFIYLSVFFDRYC